MSGLKGSTKSLLALGAILAIVAGAVLFFVSQPTTHTIYITETGFTPQTIEVPVGTVVTFINQTDSPRWPASNAHPSHTAYPEFDPKEPIPAGARWNFSFNKPGSWKYHDHLHSLKRGMVVVGTDELSQLTERCADQPTSACFEESVLTALERGGVEQAFALVQNLSSSNVAFGQDCHDYAHLIGEHAYTLFATDVDFTLTPATALCGYGFYHGFMETLLQTTGDISEARAFCEYADTQLKDQVAAVATACYHGVGHGAVDGGDPRDWGNPDAMLEPGFTFCGTFAETEFENYLCQTGAFNALERLSLEPQYQLQEIQSDPFALCNRQPRTRQEACYSNMLPALLRLTENDLVAANQYKNKNLQNPNEPAVDGISTNDLVTLGLFFEYNRLHEPTPSANLSGVELCRSLPTADGAACIMGLGGGFVKYGLAGQGFYDAIAFCGQPYLEQSEADSCYSYVLPRAKNSITETELEVVCAVLPVEYKTYCPLPS